MMKHDEFTFGDFLKHGLLVKLIATTKSAGFLVEWEWFYGGRLFVVLD